MPSPADRTPDHPGLDELLRLLERRSSLFVLTGAGCSTSSGIPDYRDGAGQWKRRRPIQYQDYLASQPARQRYWARSMAGWPRFRSAEPNQAHRALAALEQAGHIHQLVTQNVDGLHQRAGSRRVIDLHGRLDRLDCQGCGRGYSREGFQQRLEGLNPEFAYPPALCAPDGDAELEGVDFTHFRVPPCEHCGGLLKPSVVFFGEGVPAARVRHAFQRLAEADAMLVVGSSLMVYSGYRFCRAAASQGKPIAAINLGRTRADPELTLKLNAACGPELARLAEYAGNKPRR